MRTEMQKVINLNKFFKIVTASGNNISYSYEKPSQIILQNIQMQWLQFIFAKTYHHLPVFVNKSKVKKVIQRTGKPYGYTSQNVLQHNNQLVEYNLDENKFKTISELCLTVVVPKQDVMPYFMQWQRYRKYWWSSITTTPSLFTISDIKDNGKSSNANISANFNWGMKTVETLAIDGNSNSKMSSLCCKMTLEDALFTLLLDGLNNRTKEEYLHLHNKIAPYKIALALDYQDSECFNSLKELTKLMMHKLEVKNISTRCPDMLLPLNLQLKDNFQMGVPYTAIITESTLTNGILQLLNSSTMLKEQLHLIDFDSYAALLCGK